MTWHRGTRTTCPRCASPDLDHGDAWIECTACAWRQRVAASNVDEATGRIVQISYVGARCRLEKPA